MTYHEGREYQESGIVQAIETLSSIADLKVDGPIAIAEEHELDVQEFPIVFKTIHWLHHKNAEKVMGVVRNTFRVILNYLRHFYRREYGHLIEHESVEGIKTIMVLVGEAARKVDKYSHLFAGLESSVKDSKEFHELCSFYQHKIAPIVVQESLSKWMKLLPIKAVIEAAKEKKGGKKERKIVDHDIVDHLFIDLDTVKKDTEYELFFIRKDDGTRFFNPRLLRNMKLVCNFEQYYTQEGQEDPFLELSFFGAEHAQTIATTLLQENYTAIDTFVKKASKFYDNELAMTLYRTILALMLAARKGSDVKVISYKDSSNYLQDYLKFLREIVISSEYQKILTYPPKDSESLSFQILQIVQGFCKGLFSRSHISQELHALLDDLSNRGKEAVSKGSIKLPLEPTLTQKLGYSYDLIRHASDRYSHIPLIKAINALQDIDITGFDNLLLQNLPMNLLEFVLKGKHIDIIRLPSPTYQAHINKAQVTEEFKNFLRTLGDSKSPHRHLLFNLQDRTSWKEYSRCNALEDLQKKDEFSHTLTCVSMTKESDFYNQTGNYQDLNQSDIFIEHLLEHIQSENSGYYYPENIKQSLFGHFAEKLAHAVHELFFAKKNVLTKANRLDFIEIFYALFQLKIIEIVHPNSVSFTDKDGLDIGMPQTIAIFLLLKLFNKRPFSEKEENYLKVLLLIPPLLIRGRPLFLDRFTRFNNMIRLMETCIDEQGSDNFSHSWQEKIGSLYKTDILQSLIRIPEQFQ